MTLGQPLNELCLQLIGLHRRCCARPIAGAIAAHVQPPELTPPDGSTTAHGGATIAAEEADERKRRGPITRPRLGSRNEALPQANGLALAPELDRNDFGLVTQPKAISGLDHAR